MLSESSPSRLAGPTGDWVDMTASTASTSSAVEARASLETNTAPDTPIAVAPAAARG